MRKMISEKRRNTSGFETPIKKRITLALTIDYDVLQVLGISDRPTCTTVEDCTGQFC